MAKPITEKDLFEDYSDLKSAAYYFANSGDVENSLKLIEGCSKLAYEFNFLEKFADDDLENLLVRNSKSIFPGYREFKGEEKRVLFYDYFALNNRGLTQQYLRALIELDYEILFVISNDLYYGGGNDIINQLKEYPKSRIVIYSQSLTFTDRIVRLCKLIEEFKPKNAFLHLSPWDVIACSVFPLYKSIKKYFINLTDHAFWLGKNSLDVCLEFRNYGYQLSEKLRGIDKEKLVVLPYYPITPAEDSFKGLPAETNGKIIGLSGGSGYKFIGDNWKFYDLVKTLLNKHKNFVFVLVGVTGRARVLYEEKVKADNLVDKFLFLNDRYDIFQLIKNIDIYFGSYPFPGGLMSQMACIANKPVLAYTNQDFLFSYVDDLITFRDPKFKAFDSDTEFFEVASKLIESEEYRKTFSALTAKGIITPDAFATALSSVLDNGKPYNSNFTAMHKIETMSKSMSSWYLEIENTVANNYFYLVHPYYSILKENAVECKLLHKYEFSFNSLRSRIKQRIKKMVVKPLKSITQSRQPLVSAARN